MTNTRTLYLHVGLPKTGTTYLQKVIGENRAAFVAAGLGFGPYQDPVTGSHYPRFVEAMETAGIPRVIAETRACAGTRILVSDENLAAYLSMPAEGGRLYAHAIRDAARPDLAVRIVIFLRRQDYLKESIFAQSVKDWYAGSILHQTHFDYDLNGRVLRMEEVFGRDAVTVVLYDDEGPNDILGAFLRALDLALDPARLRRPAGRENPAMHRRKVLFLSQVPKAAGAQHAARTMYVPRFIARVVARSEAVADDGGRFLMSPCQRHDLVAAHAAGNRALVARHGIAAPGCFLGRPDLEAPWTPPAPITRGEIAAVTREALAACRTGRGPLGALRMATRVLPPLAAMAWAAARAPRPAQARETRSVSQA